MTGLGFPDNLMGIFGFKKVEENHMKKCPWYSLGVRNSIVGNPCNKRPSKGNMLVCPKNTDKDCNIIPKKKR